MAVFDLGGGLWTMGDLIYARHNVGFPTTDFPKTEVDTSVLSTNLTDLFNSAGVPFDYIASQAIIDNPAAGKALTLFGFSDPTLSVNSKDRIGFINSFNNGGLTSSISVFKENGGRLTSNNFDTNPLWFLYSLGNNGGVLNINTNYASSWASLTDSNYTTEPIYHQATVSSNSVSLFSSQHVHISPNVPQNNVLQVQFFYAGVLEDVNPISGGDGGYYADFDNNRIVTIVNTRRYRSSNNSFTFEQGGVHYINKQAKLLLASNDANYTITCSGGSPTPTAPWGNDVYVFDNNGSIGTPAIGRCPNLRFALPGSGIAIGQPVDFGEGGNKKWVGVGSFAGKNLLVPCYSTEP